MLENVQVLCHSSILIKKGKVIYIDPFRIKETYNDADIIMITHDHYDHYSEEDIEKIRKKATKIVLPIGLEEKTINIGFKEENIIRGKDMLSSYCKSKNLVLSDLLKPKYMQAVQEKYGFRDWESTLAALGHGGLKEGQIVNRLVEEYEKEHKKAITDETILERVAEANKNKVHVAKSKSGIVVKGIDDMAVRFSRCCSPVPGDEIVGFITSLCQLLPHLLCIIT